MKIGVIANTNKPQAKEVLNTLSVLALEAGFTLAAYDKTQTFLPLDCACEESVFIKEIDLLLVLGGDGTLLSSVRALGGADVPVIGVNLGKLGFMTSIREEELSEALGQLKAGDYRMSERMMLEATCLDKDDKVKAQTLALNEVSLGWGASPRVAMVQLAINHKNVTTYVCDGIMASTPTGSTGHSLSAGGPIVAPESRVMVINPMCPHTLTTRPLVVDDQSEISFTVTPDSRSILCAADGQLISEMQPGEVVHIQRSTHTVRLIELDSYDYFDVLGQKLNWKGSNIHG